MHATATRTPPRVDPGLRLRPAEPIRGDPLIHRQTLPLFRRIEDAMRLVLLRLLNRYDRSIVLRGLVRMCGVASPAYRRPEVKRPSVFGNILFLVSMGALAVWGIFLILYLVKCKMGINVLGGICLSRALGL